MRSAAQPASARKARETPVARTPRDEGTGRMSDLRIRSAARPAWHALVFTSVCGSLGALRRRLSPGLPLSRPSGLRDPADVCEEGNLTTTVTTTACCGCCGCDDCRCCWCCQCDDHDCAADARPIVRCRIGPGSHSGRGDIYSVTLD